MDNQNQETKNPIMSFRDLNVYQNTYRAMLLM